jgi:SAM-dependent methyltransferase
MSIVCTLCGKPTDSVLTQKIRGGVSRRVYYCPRCDLGILEGGLREGAAEDFYKKEYRRKHTHHVSSGADARELFEAYSPHQGDRLTLLAPYFGKKKTLIELGCSAGMFLYHAKKGLGTVIGVDYDARAAAYAAKVCGCVTYGTDILKTQIPKASADIVCAFQTLEHVTDPVGFTRTAGEYLKPGGILAMEVPNLYDALAALYDLPNHYQFYFHETHLWYFSEKSLRKTMKKAGFEGKVYFIQDYNVLNHLHWIDTDMPKRDGVRQLGPVALPLRGTTSRAARNDITKTLEAFDAAYRKALIRHKFSSNLFFIGKKIK